MSSLSHHPWSLRRSRTPRLASVVALVTLLGMAHATTRAQEVTVRVVKNGRGYVGKPLARDNRNLVLLRRDGRMTTLPLDPQTPLRKFADGFRPFSSQTIRGNLQQEFGSKYQVSITPNFVVVHPPGNYDRWAQPFEVLYQRFRAYFLSRGMKLDDPPFPMIAVVLRTRGEFDRFLKSYHDYDSTVLGYYSPSSNRIITYAPKQSSSDWLFRSTLIHEATHQTAYNVGIHSRFKPTPRWVSEGLAMMFEAPGVNNSGYYTEQKDRINSYRLARLKSLYHADQLDGRIASLIGSDQLFRSDPDAAYAISWGLTFFLAEHYPREYFNFLLRDARRRDFQDYTRTERLRDFALEFGGNLTDLESRMQSFIKGL